MFSRVFVSLSVLVAVGLPLSSGCGQARSHDDFGDRPGDGAVPTVGAPQAAGIIQVPTPSLPFLTVATVQGDRHRAAVRAPGQVVFRDGAQAAIGAPIAGRVSRIHVRVGDKVEAGDLLVTLISPEAAAARAELAQATAQVRAARTELDRQTRIFETGVGIRRDKFEAEIRLAEAEAALASARLAVAFLGDHPVGSGELAVSTDGASTAGVMGPGGERDRGHHQRASLQNPMREPAIGERAMQPGQGKRAGAIAADAAALGSLVQVRAPLAGMVLDRTASLGASVEPGGEALLSIGDPTALWLVADVFVDDLPLIREGADAVIEIATVAHPVRGRVESVGAVLKRELRRAPVYIAIDEDGWGMPATEESLSGAESLMPPGQRDQISLQNGMYARVRIDADRLQGVVIPATAVVIKGATQHVVYVELAPDSGRFAQRDVRVGQVIDGHIQVLSGLSVGERIVVGGALLLDGTAVLMQ